MNDTITSRIAKATTVVAGDRVTEYDTPEGPFYAVVKVNPKSLVLDDGYGSTLRLPFRPSDALRVAV